MEYAIGVDIGGTKIEAVLCSMAGKVRERVRVPTESHKSKEHIVQNIIRAVEIVKKKKVIGVGIGTPVFIKKDGKMGIIANIPAFEGYNLIKALRSRLKCPIYHDNDANCFALAEHMYGAAKGSRNTIGIIWGTGVGSGIIMDGKIYAGSNGSAGEIGHTVFDPNAPLACQNCKQKGDIESFCSAPNLIAYYRHFGGKKEVTSQYIMLGKDRIAKKVRDQCLHYLSLALAMLINTYDPEVIVLGGGVSNSPCYPEIRKRVKGFLAGPIRGSCSIRKFIIGDSAGVIGAATLAFQGGRH